MRRLAWAILLGSAVAATTAGAQTLNTGAPEAAARLLGFAPGDPSTADVLAQAAFGAYRPGANPVRWSTGAVELSRSPDGHAVSSLRVSVGGELRTPGGLPLNLAPARFEARAYEVALVRDWPAAMR